jgi:hypothetical protein
MTQIIFRAIRLPFQKIYDGLYKKRNQKLMMSHALKLTSKAKGHITNRYLSGL